MYDLNTELQVPKAECWEDIDHLEKPFRVGEDQQVIFFQATRREFHGLGRILAVSSCRLGNMNHTKEKGVDVLYTKKFSPPIALPQTIPLLSWEDERLPILLTTGFVGAIFPISRKDWVNLEQICFWI